MIVVRCSGYDAIINADALEEYLYYNDIPYEKKSFKDVIGADVFMFVIQSQNKDDINVISKNTEIPIRDFIFM